MIKRCMDSLSINLIISLLPKTVYNFEFLIDELRIVIIRNELCFKIGYAKDYYRYGYYLYVRISQLAHCER